LVQQCDELLDIRRAADKNKQSGKNFIKRRASRPRVAIVP
jgi:hypothetical protein